MAFDVYPVGANSGFGEESSIDSEKDRSIVALGGRLADFVVSPFADGDFDITTSGSSLDVDVAPGEAFLGGHRVVSDATTTLTLDASSTNYIWLVVRDAATGNAVIEYNTDGSTPSGLYAIELWEAVTDSSGVTGTTDRRPYVPFPDDADADGITGRKTGTTGPVSVASTGEQTVDVTFANPYRFSLDRVLVSLETLDDTAVNFGWEKVESKTADGFTVRVKITKAGASGSEATFAWTAYGE